MKKGWLLLLIALCVCPALAETCQGNVLKVKAIHADGDSLICYLVVYDFLLQYENISSFIGSDLLELKKERHIPIITRDDSISVSTHVMYFEEVRHKTYEEIMRSSPCIREMRATYMFSSVKDKRWLDLTELSKLVVLENMQECWFNGIYYLSDEELEILDADSLLDAHVTRAEAIFNCFCDAKDITPSLLEIVALQFVSEGYGRDWEYEQNWWREILRLPIEEETVRYTYKDIDVLAAWKALDWKRELEGMPDCRLKQCLYDACVEMDSTLNDICARMGEEQQSCAEINKALLKALCTEFNLFCSPDYARLNNNQLYRLYYDMLREARIFYVLVYWY